MTAQSNKLIHRIYVYSITMFIFCKKIKRWCAFKVVSVELMSILQMCKHHYNPKKHGVGHTRLKQRFDNLVFQNQWQTLR